MNRWDVYWIDFPFEDDPNQFKERPAIILKDQTVCILALRVTSHDERAYDYYDYALQEWQYANLAKPSVVRIKKLAQVLPEKIRGYIGRLHPVDIMAIQLKMKQWKEERDRRFVRR